jgi:hypothetical protein
MKPDDAKRKYAGFGQFIADLWFVISSIFRAWDTLTANRVSRALAEKIMLAVTCIWNFLSFSPD